MVIGTAPKQHSFIPLYEKVLKDGLRFPRKHECWKDETQLQRDESPPGAAFHDIRQGIFCFLDF